MGSELFEKKKFYLEKNDDIRYYVIMQHLAKLKAGLITILLQDTKMSNDSGSNPAKYTKQTNYRYER